MQMLAHGCVMTVTAIMAQTVLPHRKANIEMVTIARFAAINPQTHTIQATVA